MSLRGAQSRNDTAGCGHSVCETACQPNAGCGRVRAPGSARFPLGPYDNLFGEIPGRPRLRCDEAAAVCVGVGQSAFADSDDGLDLADHGARIIVDAGVTNVRNVKSSHWRRWLGPESRCVVPFTSFSENEMLPDGRKPPIWFALAEDRPVACFAGIWTPWTSARKVKEGEVTADLFAFLTCDPNTLVRHYHPRAMPVILTTQSEIDTWMEAPTPNAHRSATAAPAFGRCVDDRCPRREAGRRAGGSGARSAAARLTVSRWQARHGQKRCPMTVISRTFR
jgi:hypothetical protein